MFILIVYFWISCMTGRALHWLNMTWTMYYRGVAFNIWPILGLLFQNISFTAFSAATYPLLSLSNFYPSSTHVHSLFHSTKSHLFLSSIKFLAIYIIYFHSKQYINCSLPLPLYFTYPEKMSRTSKMSLSCRKYTQIIICIILFASTSIFMAQG